MARNFGHARAVNIQTWENLKQYGYTKLQAGAELLGGCVGGGVTPPQRLKNGVVVGQFANLLGNILHGQFSPTFAILREKYI